MPDCHPSRYYSWKGLANRRLATLLQCLWIRWYSLCSRQSLSNLISPADLDAFTSIAWLHGIGKYAEGTIPLKSGLPGEEHTLLVVLWGLMCFSLLNHYSWFLVWEWDHLASFCCIIDHRYASSGEKLAMPFLHLGKIEDRMDMR